MNTRYTIILEKVVKEKIKPTRKATKSKTKILMNPPDKSYGALFTSG